MPKAKKTTGKTPREPREKPEIIIEEIDDGGNRSSDWRTGPTADRDSGGDSADGITASGSGSDTIARESRRADSEARGMRDAFGSDDNSSWQRSFSDELSDGRNDEGIRSGESNRGRRSYRSRARANQRSGSQTASQNTPSDSDTVPRKVGYGTLGGGKPQSKQSIRDAELTAVFFAETWALIFHLIGVLVNDPEWRLPADDGEELGERTQRWIATLDAKRFARVQKFFGKVQPASSLLFSLAAVIGPRIAHTRSLNNAVASQAKGKGTRRDGQTASSSAEASSNMAGEDANGARAPGSPRGGPEQVAHIPFGSPRWDSIS